MFSSLGNVAMVSGPNYKERQNTSPTIMTMTWSSCSSSSMGYAVNSMKGVCPMAHAI